MKEFRAMTQAQSEMLSSMEYAGNNMPHTFVILPEVVYEKLTHTASVVDKMKNVAKRKTKKMKNLLWSKSRIVFICPITLKQVCYYFVVCCVVSCCVVLYCTVWYGIVLYCVVLYCIVLYCIVQCNTVLYCIE